MPHPMLHGLCLRGYAPYSHGLRSGSTEWIIRRIAHKRKSTNLFIIFKEMNKFFISFITNYTCLWCRYVTTLVVCMTLVICPTPIGRRDFGHMPNSGWKTWLRSYVPIPIDVTTLIVSPNSDHVSQLWSMSVLHVLPPQLWKTSHGRARWLQHLIARTLSQK
jgi:hypothetical protein